MAGRGVMESVGKAITTCQTKQLRRNGGKLSKRSQRWHARAPTHAGGEESARAHACRTKQLLSKFGRPAAKLPQQQPFNGCHAAAAAAVKIIPDSLN